MAQERQIIGYKPDGTPIEGPPLTAPPTTMTVGQPFPANLESLGGPAQPRYKDPLDADRRDQFNAEVPVESSFSFLDFFKDLLASPGKAVQLGKDALKAKVDYDLGVVDQVASGARSAASAVYDFGRDLKTELPNTTAKQGLQALSNFGEGVTGEAIADYGEEGKSAMGNLALGAGVMAGMVGGEGEVAAMKNIAPSGAKWIRRTMNVLRSELDPKNFKRFSLNASGPTKRFSQWLHPDEVRLLTGPQSKASLAEFERVRAGMPSAEEISGAIAGGAPKQGWYRNSRGATQHLFQDDADLFAGVMAATSPQNSVEMNLENATRIYTNWVKAGRPQSRQAIENVMANSVVGNKGAGSVLDAWVDNTVAVLTGGKTISGPKVDSFWGNLMQRARPDHGNIAPEQAVTLDAWMSNLFGVQQEYFSGNLDKARRAAALLEGNPGKGAGYLAGTSLMREAADRMGLQPEEAQEMAWTFGKALYEKAESLGIPAREVIERGLLSEADLLKTPDFATLLRDDRYAGALKELPGMTERMASMPAASRASAREVTAKQRQFMLKSADVLDELRGVRRIGTAHKTAQTTERTAIASVPLEAAPSGNLGIDPGFRQRSPGSQDYASNVRLGAFEDLRGRNVALEGVLPGRTGEQLPGRGVYADKQPFPFSPLIETNKLKTAPVEVRTNRRGTALNLRDEDAMRQAHIIQSGMLGQEAAAYSAISFPKDLDAAKANAVRFVTPHTLNESAVKQIAAQLDLDQFALQHRSTGVDILKFWGGPLTPAERQHVEQLVLSQMPPPKPGDPAAKFLYGLNIADPEKNYTILPFKDGEGSRAVTNMMVSESGYTNLTKAQRKSLDSPGMRRAAQEVLDDIIRTNPQSRKDHQNLLRIIAERGVSGLVEALGDPSQVLPVLVGLGISGAVIEQTLRSETAGRQTPSRGGRP